MLFLIGPGHLPPTPLLSSHQSGKGGPSHTGWRELGVQENILDEGQGLKSPGSHLYASLLPPTTPFNPAPTPWYQGSKASAKVQHE